MKSDRTNKPKNELRVELKYCEGCGGLGLRECGGGQVYCDDCARKMADLAVSKTPSRRPTLPVGRRSVLNDHPDNDRADNDRADSSNPKSEEPDFNDPDSDDLDAMASAANRFALRIAAAGGAA